MCRRRFHRWNTALDTDDRAIDRIAKWIARQTSEYDGEVLATLEGHWTYLVNNNDRMRYAIRPFVTRG